MPGHNPLAVLNGSSLSVLSPSTAGWPATPTTVVLLIYLLLVSKSFQPGTPLVPVASRWNVSLFSSRNDGGSHSLSGTSMAAAHVAGIVAYLLSVHGQMETSDMLDLLVSLSVKGVIRMSRPAKQANTPNRLAQSGVPVDNGDHNDNNISHAGNNLTHADNDL